MALGYNGKEHAPAPVIHGHRPRPETGPEEYSRLTVRVDQSTMQVLESLRGRDGQPLSEYDPRITHRLSDPRGVMRWVLRYPAQIGFAVDKGTLFIYSKCPQKKRMPTRPGAPQTPFLYLDLGRRDRGDRKKMVTDVNEPDVPKPVRGRYEGGRTPRNTYAFADMVQFEVERIHLGDGVFAYLREIVLDPSGLTSNELLRLAADDPFLTVKSGKKGFAIEKRPKRVNVSVHQGGGFRPTGIDEGDRQMWADNLEGRLVDQTARYIR